MTTIEGAPSSEAFEVRLEATTSTIDALTKIATPGSLSSGDIEQTASSLTAGKPDLIVFQPGDFLNTAIVVAERIDTLCPEISNVLVATPSPKVLERAMAAGMRAVLAPDADQEEIFAVLSRAASVAQKRRRALTSEAPGTPMNRILPVLAAKGGSGKTVVSTNLATSLAREFPGEVVLVDLDVQFGDVASGFGLEPIHTITDVCNQSESFDTTRLKAMLTPHEAAGLFILAAPHSPAEADELDPTLLAKVVEMLSNEFRYVVVDTAAGIDEFTLEVLDIATDLILVASMDVPSVRAISKEIAALELLGLEDAEWHLVLNNASAKVGLTVDDVESALGRQVDVRIPATKSIPLSVNRGVPVALQDPRSPAGRAFNELAGRAVPVQATNNGKRRRRRTAK